MKLHYVTPDRRIPDDICYFIDCAVEASDLMYDEAFWLRYFCQDPGVLVNGPKGPPHRQHPEDLYISTGEANGRVKQAFLRWWNNPKTPVDHRLICAAVGSSSVRNIVRDTAKYIAECTIIEEGANSRFFRSMEADTKIVRKFKPHRITATGGNHPVSIRDWKPCIDSVVPAKHMKDLRALLDRIAQLDEWADEVAITVTPQTRLAWRKYDRDERKAIRRGIELLADLIGEDAMRDFLRTRKLEIQGEKFSIRLTLEHLKESHGGATTKVYVGEDEICSLCIYTPETPILDHVASLITHVRAGLEDEIIEIGNPFSIKAKEPTGVEVLDKRIFPEEKIRREPIVVTNVIHPHVVEYVRLGDSPFTKKLQDKAIRRISGYLYQTYLDGAKVRRSKVRYSYPLELRADEYFNIPPGFVMRSDTPGLGGPHVELVQPIQNAGDAPVRVIVDDDIDAGYDEVDEADVHCIDAIGPDPLTRARRVLAGV